MVLIWTSLKFCRLVKTEVKIAFQTSLILKDLISRNERMTINIQSYDNNAVRKLIAWIAITIGHDAHSCNRKLDNGLKRDLFYFWNSTKLENFPMFKNLQRGFV